MRVNEYLKVVNKDPERKKWIRIVFEALHAGVIEREKPLHYFTNLLYKKGADDYKNYIGFRKGYNIINNFYFPNGKNDELEDKLVFSQKAKENNINSPLIVAITDKKQMNVGGETFNVKTFENFIEVLSSLLAAHNKQLFLKPIDGEGGKNSFKITDKSDVRQLKRIFGLFDELNFVFQEIIIQDERINHIYDKSINTIRMHTYKESNNQTEVVSALMRFGHGGSVVDNISVGGFWIPVDLKKWTLNGVGRSFLNQGGETFSKHPDSNVKLDNFKLPYKKETLELVKRASLAFDEKLVGWDVALTENGPTIVEGNAGPHIFMLQMECGGIKNHPRYKEIFSNYI